MKYINHWISLFAVALLLSACSNTQNTPPQSNPNAQGGGNGQQGQSGGGRGGSGQGNGKGNSSGYYDGSFGNGSNQGNNGSATQAALLKQRVIYFAYDSSQITTEGMAILAAHARSLATHPNKRVRLEGHADERGSREYNVALSLERAISAENVLNNKGANANIRTIPYGEEMPAVLGHDSSAWDKNRRVEIVY